VHLAVKILEKLRRLFYEGFDNFHGAPHGFSRKPVLIEVLMKRGGC
jgi:hypothetical protein